MKTTTTDIYLDTLCLLIYSSDDISKILAAEILKMFEEDIKENPIMDNPELRFWLDMIREIVETKIDVSKPSETKILLVKYKESFVAKSHPELIDTLEEIINERSTVTASRIEALKTSINNWLLYYKSEKFLKRASKAASRFPNVSNLERQKALIEEIYECSKHIAQAHEESVVSMTEAVDFIDFSNRDSLRKILTVYKTKRSSSVIRFGLQGFNRMMDSKIQGMKPGEFGCIVSPSGHGKSYTLMNMARWVATYNKPQAPVGTKPAIVFITLENELDENTALWFKDAYINLFHKQPIDLTDDEVIESVASEYGKNGITLLVFRRLAGHFGYEEYVSLIKRLREQGWYIVFSLIDYITKMKLDEISGGNSQASQLQYLVQNMKTFANHENIPTMTAMQIDREGIRLLSGNSYIVKKMTGANMATCSYAYHEFDLVIFQAMEEIEGQGKYLTMKMDKHRYGIIDPETKFAAWRFGSLGIMDDINGEDTRIVDIYDDSFTPQSNDVNIDLKSLMPTPPDKESRKETESDIVITTKLNPMAPPIPNYFEEIGVPLPIADRQKVIPLDAVRTVVPTITSQPPQVQLSA